MTSRSEANHRRMSDAQIKYMVDRFLWWKLPDNFIPDCGIHFDADAARKLNPRNGRYEPVGTNLFSATQAEAMVRHITEGMPVAPPEDAVGAAERGVGQWVYRRIEVLMDAKPGTPEGTELAYLAAIAADVEEYGATGDDPVSAASPSPASNGEQPWNDEQVQTATRAHYEHHYGPTSFDLLAERTVKRLVYRMRAAIAKATGNASDGSTLKPLSTEKGMVE